MSVTVEIVPPGVGPVGAAHHLYTLLAALVVVGLPGTPVGVSERCAIAPRIAYVIGIMRYILRGASFQQGPRFKTHILLTSFCGIVLEADPLAAGFAVQRQELLLLLTVDADQISSS